MSDNNLSDSECGSEIGLDQKTWDRIERRAHPNDKARRARYVAIQLRKAQQKRRKQGRKKSKIEPHAGGRFSFLDRFVKQEEAAELADNLVARNVVTDPPAGTDTDDDLMSQPNMLDDEDIPTRSSEDDSSYDSSEFTVDDLSPTWRKAIGMIADCVSKTLPSDQYDITATVTHVGLYLLSISRSRDMNDLLCHTLNTLGQHVHRDHIQMVEMYMRELYSRTRLETQASFMGCDLRSWIVKLRTTTAHFEDLPAFDIIKKGIMIMTFFQFKPSSCIVDKGILTDFFLKIEDSVAYKDVNSSTIFDAVLSIVEYTLEAVDIFRSGGSIKSMLLPSTIHSRYAELDAHFPKYRNGSLSEDGLNNDVFEMSANALYTELKLQLTLKSCLPDRLKTPYTQYYKVVTTWILTIQEKTQSKTYRMAPFAIALTGESSIGKSDAGERLTRVVAAAMGARTDDKHMISLNENSKYFDGYTNDIEVIVLDDMWNVKRTASQYVDSFAANAIRLVNNVPFLTNQADLADKGSIYARPKVIAATSNVEDLGAATVSNEPISITRRFHLIQTRVAPKYAQPNGMLDVSKIEKDAKGHPIPPNEYRRYRYVIKHTDPIPPVNNTIKKKFPAKKASNARVKSITKEFIDEFWMDESDMRLILLRKAKLHREQQEAYLNQRDKRNNILICMECGGDKGSSQCDCDAPETPLENRVFPESDGYSIADTHAALGESFSYHQHGGVISVIEPEALSDSAIQVFQFVERFAGAYYYDVINHFAGWEPPAVIRLLHRYCCRISLATTYVVFKLLWEALLILYERFHSRKTFWFAAASNFWIIVFVIKQFTMPVWIALFLIMVIFFSCMAEEIRRAATIAVFRHANQTLTGGLTPMRVASVFAATYAAIAAVRNAIRLAATFQQVSPIETEGNLAPTSMEDVVERKGEQSFWEPSISSVKEISPPEVKTMTPMQIWNKLSKNYVLVDCPKIGSRSTGLFIDHCHLLLPHHMAKPMLDGVGDYPTVKIYRKANDPTTAVVTYLVNYQQLKDSQGRDLDFGLFYVNTRSGVASILNLFADEPRGKCTAKMFAKNPDGTAREYDLLYDPTDQMDNGNKLGIRTRGSRHKMRTPTFKGDCTSPVISVTSPRIISLHSGGSAEGTAPNCLEAVCYDLTQSSIREGMDAMRTVKIDPESARTPMLVSKLKGFHNEDVKGLPIVDLGDLHPRSRLNFLLADEQHNVSVLGSDRRTRSQYFSDVQTSPGSAALEHAGLPKEHGRPKFRANFNFGDYITKGTQNAHEIYPPLLEHCMEEYLDGVLGELKKLDFKPPVDGMLTMDQTLNGVPKQKYYKQLDANTSGGPGYKGKKIDWLEVSYDPIFGNKTYTVTQEIKDGCDFIMQEHMHGEMHGPIVRGALKDEPVPLGSEKVRAFSCYSMPFFMNGKQLFLPILDALYTIPLVSELWQGVNCVNDEWDQLHEYIFGFETKWILEGDFSKYDLVINGQLIRAAGIIAREVAASPFFKYTDEQLTALESYICDLATSIFLMNGDVFVVDGWVPSGCILTIFLNGTCNALLHRVAYYLAGAEQITGKLDMEPPVAVLKKVAKFRSNVHLGTVGDDSIGSSRVKWFNMALCQKIFASYRIKYTDGKKSAIVPLFTTEADARFCKRAWRWEPYMNHYVAPLDLMSISKSLHCYRRSATCALDIFIQNVDGALRELARHEDHVFESWRTRIHAALEEMQITHLVSRISWTRFQWMDELLRANYGVVPYDSPLETLGEQESDFMAIETHSSYTPPSVCADVNSRCKQKTLLLWLPMVVLLTLSLGLQQFMSVTVEQGLIPPCQTYTKPWITTKNIQSSETAEVIHFADNTAHWESSLDTAQESTIWQARTNDTNDGFLSRPILIGTFTWQVGIDDTLVIDPWSLVCENSKVINRLAHFKNLRSDLKVKFLINGNPFYYGRLIASYFPLPENDNVSVFRPGVKADLVEASQRPHIYLDPTMSEGGDLLCPFIFPKNAVDIPRAEWGKLGNIIIAVMNTLQHANGGVDPLVVSIFAYLDNPDLSVPTSLVPDTIEPQSDEYGKISAPAHSIANWSGKLANAPFIGAYARATQLLATTVGNVAALFGFSKPRELSCSTMNLDTMPAFNVTTGQYSGQTFALDPKKEVTIDPRVVGAGSHDEMALVPLAMRESYVTTFVWRDTDPQDSLLFNIRVGPTLGAVHDDELHVIPAAWVAAPFQYWTGSTDFRIQCVSSAYHRGRIRVVWDPDEYSTGDYNTNYQYIIDISERKDFSIRVGWGQQTNYLEVDYLTNVDCYDTDEPLGRNAKYNGTLSVYVVNALTSPSQDPNPIELNVFANMAQDFEVAGPTNLQLNLYQPNTSFTEIDPPGPIGDVVVKRGEPHAVIFGTDMYANNPIPSPRWTSKFESTSARRMSWYGGSFQYELLAMGGPGGTTFTPSIDVINNNNAAVDVSVFIAGQLAQTSIPSGVGEVVRLTFPTITVPQGINYVPFTAECTNDIFVDNVDTTLGINHEITGYWDEVAIAASSQQLNVSGNLANGAPNTVAYCVPPTDIVPGTKSTLITLNAMKLNGVDYSTTTTTSQTTDGAYMFPFQYFNGLLQIEAPDVASTNPWFASAAHMYYVNDLTPTAMNLIDQMSQIMPQSDEYGVEASDNSANAPTIEEPKMFIAPSCECGPANQVYFGEQAASWRQLLKRITTSYVYRPSAVTGNKRTIVIPQYPVPNRIAPYTGDTVSSTQHLFNWVSVAYIAIRGGMRVDVIPMNTFLRNPTIFMSRIPSTNGGLGPFSTNITDPRVDFSGGVISNSSFTGRFSAELPYYSRYRFQPGRTERVVDLNNYIERDSYALSYINASANVVDRVELNILYSTAEDFSCSFFLSTPILIPRV